MAFFEYRMLIEKNEWINVFTNGRTMNVAAVLLTESKLGPINSASVVK